MAGRTFQAGVSEGQSTTRPPFFDGTNNAYWKERMRIFIQSNDFDSWMVIKHGNTTPANIVDGIRVPKLESEYDDQDKKNVMQNAKAINDLYCAVNPDDYRKISRCKSANEMWTKLEVTYEGTSQVKDAKVDILLHEYELFSMNENESIDSYFERFSTITNNLDTLGKYYTDHELVRKILRCMTPEWKSEVNAITEGRDYNVLTYDTLRGKLLTYETTTPHLRGEDKRRKSIALKATKEVVEENEEEDDESLNLEDNPELALVIKRFNKFIKKSFKPRKDNGKKATPPKCYECGEIGHIKPYCPKLKQGKDKKFKKKQKAYISWESDHSSSETSDEDEETANLCLMATEEELRSSGLINVVTIHESHIPVNYIKAFYSDMTFKRRNHQYVIISKFCGKEVTISSGELNEMFGMENSNKELTTQNNDQNPWYNFDEQKCWEVMDFRPKFNESGRPKPVSINWGKYILTYMNLCRAKKKSLPYPMLLTYLLKRKGFEFVHAEMDSETPFWRIKRSTVMRTKLDGEDEARAETGTSQSHVASRGHKVTLPMLFESLQSLQSSFNNIQLQQATYGYNLNKMFVKSGEQWEKPSLKALAPYMSQGSSSHTAPSDADNDEDDADDEEEDDIAQEEATMDEE
ncbi:unnamed protein product [Cuscuta campestris]|uniref:CCHC-type domain-containing protein n=1 Tax=Cuscuta campestris TaxID=132261 RepID=A0A484L067_9ASTE|nr:unnamed protein product [Cuscuta campestris]